jgi:hypothetical protein
MLRSPNRIRRTYRRSGATSAFALTLAGTLSFIPDARANEGTAAIFVRGDTDATTVISPHVGVRARFNEDRTTADVGYTADIWTSASIDIRTAATKPVTEQRDQIDAAVNHEFDDVSIGGSYYFSGENDYWSHGVGVRSTQDLPNGTTTLEESFRFAHDTVGRSGDDEFSRPLSTYGLRLVMTQILSGKALVQGVWEGAYRQGFQSSPYRFVGLGGDGQCGGTAALCVPEAHPDTRIRNAFVLRGRYALSSDTSAGIGYRLYFDDWGVTAHTAGAQIAWLPLEDATLTLRYRFYTQSAAAFYRSTYPEPAGGLRYATRDRELSPMFSNRLALSFDKRFELGEDIGLRLAVALGGTVFVYQDFVGLSEIFAGDATLSVSLEL